MVSLDNAPGSATTYGIPASHRDCYLETFEWSACSVDTARIRAFLEELEALIEGEAERPPHVIMQGPAGLGKTHLAVGFYRWAVYRTDLSRAAFIHVPSFCDEVKASFDGGGDPFDRIRDADVLVALDDLFGRDLSPWEVNNVIPRLISTAYRNSAALLVTMNPTFGEMENALYKHEISRIAQNADYWEFEGKDWRLR